MDLIQDDDSLLQLCGKARSRSKDTAAENSNTLSYKKQDTSASVSYEIGQKPIWGDIEAGNGNGIEAGDDVNRWNWKKEYGTVDGVGI